MRADASAGAWKWIAIFYYTKRCLVIAIAYLMKIGLSLLGGQCRLIQFFAPGYPETVPARFKLLV